MSSHRRYLRRGGTLVELMITMLVISIAGTAFVRLALFQSRHFASQSDARNARAVSRGALNVLLSELRMVEAPGGVVSAIPQQVTVRVPYAFGLLCATAAGSSTVSLLPVDSAMYAAAGNVGYGWRGSSGAFTYVENGVTLGAGVDATCTGAGITTLTGGRVITVSPALPAAATVATPVLLSHRVTYGFLASVALPGRLALWRGVDGVALAEELVAPFDTSARFRFYVLNNADAQHAAPASLADLRGLELLLNGQGEGTVSGGAAVKTTPVTTAVYFKNRLQ
jgi:prepilin-type N-terminal cleavage/methylation domain-containing protein